MTGTNEFESLERDLEVVFAAPVPAISFSPGTSSRVSRFSDPTTRWRVGLAGAVAAAVVALAAVLPGYLVGAHPVNAEELLTRSADASARLKTSSLRYHIRESFEGKGNAPFVTETWSFGAAGNRSESRGTDGTLLYGQTVTPTDTWLYATVGGHLRVVHIGGGEEARLRDFDAQPASLQELIGGMVISGCQEATSRGSARVAGRDTYVIAVVPTPSTCTAVPGRPETQKLAAATAEMGGYTVWIDKETSLQLKVEAHDASGAMVKAYTALSFETGPRVDSAVLAFTPPAGAIVIEAATYSEAKSALYGTGK